MMCAGFYMLLQSIIVTPTFGMGMGLFHFALFGGIHITSGMIMIPLIFGIGMIFFNSRNYLGWALAVGSLVALIAGVISSIQLTFRAMGLFDLLVILVLSVGGVGLFIRSLKDMGKE